MKKLCILFPGIGYHCDKPLLYYSSRLARSRGYEVRALRFTDFPSGAKGNEEKMRLAAAHALSQSEEQLNGADFAQYGRIVFIGKSIGTCACLAYREKMHIQNVCGILFTPLGFTFEHDTTGFTALHGTADPWAKTEETERLCREKGVPLFEFQNADHSLETGDTFTDLQTLQKAIEKAGEIIL